MRLVGSAVSGVGVLLLALWGFQQWGAGCPCMVGLSQGQVVVVLALVIAVGMGMSWAAERRTIRIEDR
jgi:hypothetical protein